MSTIISLAQFLTSEAPLYITDIQKPKMGGVNYSFLEVAIPQAQLVHAQSRLIVCQSNLEAERLYHLLDEVMDEVYLIPHHALEAYEGAVPSMQFWESRLKVFHQNNKQIPSIYVSSLDSITERIPNPQQILTRILLLEVSQCIEIRVLLSKLIELGYKEVSLVEKPGDFSRRGSIVDVYPLLSENAYRLDFFDHEIETIRVIDLFSQRSKENKTYIEITPLSEIPLPWIPHKYDSESQWNYWRKTKYHPKLISWFDLEWDQIIFFGDQLWESKYAQLWQTRIKEYSSHLDHGDLDSPHHGFLSLDEFQEKLVQVQLFYEAEVATIPSLQLTLQQRQTFHHANFLAQAQSWFEEQISLWIFANSQAQGERLQRQLEGIPFCGIVIGNLSCGFMDHQHRFVFWTDHQLFQRMRSKRKRSKFGGGGITIPNFDALDYGDYVIHQDYGIGRFIGIKREKTVHGAVDCIVIEYASKDRLTIPISDLNKIEKCPLSEENEPTLHSLGSKKWDHQKEKARKKAAQVAEELVKIYASRMMQQGYAFPSESEELLEFDRSFPWEPTPDQMTAHQDVARDMSSQRPMDRLVCGDVGFGKTEVAMRAAFRAVIAGKQVALMVPTTLLASQHFENFLERFESWPIRIELLSRFRSAKEKKEVIQGLKTGMIDMVIGTQSLLAKSMGFKDLGLLIIDEEQKFGVKQKEQIRNLRTMVDTLTLTATPIPRTLHLSMVGARDISVIRTPPRQRLPVETRVMAWNSEILGDALRYELSRGGQCFVVQDRIEGLLELGNKIVELIPSARVTLLHGQLSEDELEKNMSAFVHGEFDVLISTNIVESGIDIPRANTMIVYQAQRFGLSQLYQLRGRVGRADLSAFCYLVYPPHLTLRRESEERLRALEAHTELGAGFQLAMRDLEIRGAGNLLGMEQSGFYLELGYETYVRLVKEELRRLQGETRPLDIDPKIQIQMNAYLPEFYLDDGVLRLSVYQKISRAESIYELDEILMELTERFGEVPIQVQHLILLMKTRLGMKKWGLTDLDLQKGWIILRFSEYYEPSRIEMEQLISSCPESIQFSMSKPMEMKIVAGRLSPEVILEKMMTWLNCPKELVLDGKP